jgi:hypothetical protein
MLTTSDLLMREAAFSSRSIGIGLTELRKYDFANKGSFFHALASIALGVERLLKLLVMYSHRIENNDSFPTNNELKDKYGHKIIPLRDYVRRFSEIRGYTTSWAVHGEDLSKRILNILSDFARFSRYYNLDVLTGLDVKEDEPLVRWEKEVGSIILKRHPPKSQIRPEKFNGFCAMLDSVAEFKHTGVDGAELIDARSMILASESSLPMQKFSFFYTYRIIRVLAQLLMEVEMKAGFYPFLYEFFSIFMIPNDKYVLGKKSWIE